MTESTDDDAVIVERYADVQQAEFAVSVLAGSGIEAFVHVPYISSMLPYTLGSGGVSVIVRAGDVDQAKEILANEGEEPAQPDSPA
jgi:hypothetical protein